MKKKSKNKRTRKKKKSEIKKKLKFIFIGVVVLSVLIIFYNGYENKKLENFCLSIERHPDLNYPCRCLPGLKVSDISEEILSKTKPLCTCICMVNGTEEVFPVLLAK